MKPLFSLFFLLLYLISISGYPQGLGFNSSKDEIISKRTSYKVFANETQTFNDYLNISFQLSINNLIQPGYICTINFNDDEHIYSLYFLEISGINYLKLNKEGESNLLTIPLSHSVLEIGNWNSIKLNFDFNSNDITITVNNEDFTCKSSGYNKTMDANVFFGKHANIIDVPDYAIKGLEITDAKNYHKFIFYEDSGNSVHDEQGHPIGHVDNPKWLVNDSYHWKHRYTKSCDNVSVVQYNPKTNELIIAENDSLTLVNMTDNSSVSVEYANLIPVPLNLGMSCMNGNDLLVYELKNFIAESPTFALLNMENFEWKIRGYQRLYNERHHHNAYFNNLTQQLYIFGGFGDKQYYNSFFLYDLLSDSLQLLQLSGDTIPPRFFSGMTAIDNHLIVFGGVGNRSGDQSIGKRYYYDCYSIDMKNLQVKKLWEMDRGETRLVSSRNLLLTPDSNAFYTLSYPEYIPNTFLKLYKYNINDGAFEIVGDSIPMVSEEIKTNANIYFNEQTNEIYAVMQQFIDNNGCIIKLYSINNPPLALDYFGDRFKLPETKNPIINALLLILGISIIAYLYIFQRKKLNRKTISNEKAKLQKHTTKLHESTSNAVFLFGEFAVFDRKGKNISYLFSPQMKELFLLILEKSALGGNGVSSEQIYETIWPDKELKNAKNLKGVTINKIRHILSDLDGIELAFENKNFFIKIQSPFYCDFQRFIDIYFETQAKIEKDYVEELNFIISKGGFLKSSDADWLDPIKARVSDQILGIAPLILKNFFQLKEYAACIFFAKNLYYTDEINDCAFYFIIQANLALNGKIEAKKHYSKYVSKFQSIQNEDYPYLFSDVVIESRKYIKNI